MSPKLKQTFFEDMFDEETVERWKDAADEDAFKLVEPAPAEYRCPRCSFGWRGNPLPPVGAPIEEDVDAEA